MYSGNEDNKKCFPGETSLSAGSSIFLPLQIFVLYDAAELQGEDCSSKHKGCLYQILLLYIESLRGNVE